MLLSLSPRVSLAALFLCCGLLSFGGVSADTANSSSKPNLSLAAKYLLGGLSDQQKHQQHGLADKDTAGNDSFERRLETRACGDEIGRVTVSEIRALASTVLTVVLKKSSAPALLESTVELYTSSLRYNLVAYKVCGSCAETQASLSEQALLQDESVFGSFSSYCATDKYGYSAQHSALVFVPVVTTDTTNAVTERSATTAVAETTTIVEGSLRSLVKMHVTKISVSAAPTQDWPANLTEALTLFGDSSDDTDNAILLAYFGYLTPLVGAGSGAVTIAPDYIGYGASLKTHNRTFAYPPTYMQAAVTTWMATKQAIEQDTYGWSINDRNGGCTVMDSVVSLTGGSEGGYAAIAAAPAMQQAGLRVLSVNAGATFLDPGDSMEFAIGMYQYGHNGYMNVCGSRRGPYPHHFIFVSGIAVDRIV
jgi:hypothetical protein